MFKKYDVDFVYGNIDMINSKMKTIRTWRLSGNVDFDIENAQIPHPAFFVKKQRNFEQNQLLYVRIRPLFLLGDIFVRIQIIDNNIIIEQERKRPSIVACSVLFLFDRNRTYGIHSAVIFCQASSSLTSTKYSHAYDSNL